MNPILPCTQHQETEESGALPGTRNESITTTELSLVERALKILQEFLNSLMCTGNTGWSYLYQDSARMIVPARKPSSQKTLPTPLPNTGTTAFPLLGEEPISDQPDLSIEANDLRTLRQNVDELDKKSGQLALLLRECDNDYKKCLAEVTTYSGQAINLLKKRTELENRIVNLREKQGVIRTKQENIESKWNQERDSAELAQGKLNAVQKNLDACNQEIKTLEQQATSLTADIARKKASFVTKIFRRNLDPLMSELEQVESSLQEKRLRFEIFHKEEIAQRAAAEEAHKKCNKACEQFTQLNKAWTQLEDKTLKTIEEQEAELHELDGLVAKVEENQKTAECTLMRAAAKKKQALEENTQIQTECDTKTFLLNMYHMKQAGRRDPFSV
jgi:chromosome segregation ATPase